MYHSLTLTLFYFRNSHNQHETSSETVDLYFQPGFNDGDFFPLQEETQQNHNEIEQNQKENQNQKQNQQINNKDVKLGIDHKRDTDSLLRKHLKLYPRQVKCCGSSLPSLLKLDYDVSEAITNQITRSFKAGSRPMCKIILASLLTLGFVVDLLCPIRDNHGKNSTSFNTETDHHCNPYSVPFYFWDFGFGVIITVLLLLVKPLPWFIDCSCMTPCVLFIWACNCCCGKSTRSSKGCCRCLCTGRQPCLKKRLLSMYHTLLAGLSASGVILSIDVCREYFNWAHWFTNLLELLKGFLFPVSYNIFQWLSLKGEGWCAYVFEFIVCTILVAPALILRIVQFKNLQAER